MHEFADLSRRTSGLIVTKPKGETTFVVRPVFGGADRPNAILGILYQHNDTEKHCQLKESGVDPRVVDTTCQVTRVDVSA